MNNNADRAWAAAVGRGWSIVSYDAGLLLRHGATGYCEFLAARECAPARVASIEGSWLQLALWPDLVPPSAFRS